MTPAAFTEAFVSLYRRAREVKFAPDRVTRARARSVSAELEELVAAYIVNNSAEDLHIYVDQPVSVGGGKTPYPDLVVLNKSTNIVTAIADIKTDIGWKRDGIKAMCSKLSVLRDEIIDKGGVNLGPTPKERSHFPVSGSLSCHLIIGTAANSGDLLQKEDAQQIAKDCGVLMYVLSEGLHPNHFSRQANNIFPGLKIRDQDFSLLLSNMSTV